MLSPRTQVKRMFQQRSEQLSQIQPRTGKGSRTDRSEWQTGTTANLNERFVKWRNESILNEWDEWTNGVNEWMNEWLDRYKDPSEVHWFARIGRSKSSTTILRSWIFCAFPESQNHKSRGSQCKSRRLALGHTGKTRYRSQTTAVRLQKQLHWRLLLMIHSTNLPVKRQLLYVHVP